MVKAPIKVIIRCRPTVQFAQNNIKIDESTSRMAIYIPKDEEKGFVNHQQENWSFQFDKVLQNAPQEVVFDICCKDIIHSLIEGYSGTLMCYGQTGSGKTFTTSGSFTDYKYRGMIPRAISMIFQEIQSRYEQQITVRVSYLEIYNEQMCDLLALAFQPEKAQNLAIQEDTRGQINVKGLMQKECSNEEECLSLFFEGETNRTISEHKLNKQSSRSHSIFSISLEMRSRVESSEKVIISKLNLVDLAGSERTKKTGSDGINLLEAQYINKSLSFLEQVVVAHTEKQRDHIPYRQCKLTNILKDSIGGNCKTYLIANVWPEKGHLEETISTLKFASRMMKVTNEPAIRINLDPNVLLKKYEKEIRELKQELAMHDTLANRGRINYEPYSPEQQYVQQQLAKQFLEGEIEDIEFDSLRQVKELFFQFRNIYKNLKKNIVDYNLDDPQKADQNKQAQKNRISNLGQQVEGVGIDEFSYGIGIGKAPRDAKPQGQKLESLVNVQKDEGPSSQNEVNKGRERSVSPEQEIRQEKRLVNVDKNEVYNEYKDSEGKEYNDAFLKNTQDLKEKKVEIKELTAIANKLKEEIEAKKDILNKKQEGKNQEEIQQGIIDEEEYEIIKQLKDLKKRFKQHSDHIKSLKSAIVIIEQNINQCKYQLLAQFEKWFRKRYGISVYDLDNPNINSKSEERVSDIQSDDHDQEALTYNKAKKKVNDLQKARKQEKYKN